MRAAIVARHDHRQILARFHRIARAESGRRRENDAVACIESAHDFDLVAAHAADADDAIYATFAFDDEERGGDARRQVRSGRKGGARNPESLPATGARDTHVDSQAGHQASASDHVRRVAERVVRRVRDRINAAHALARHRRASFVQRARDDPSGRDTTEFCLRKLKADLKRREVAPARKIIFPRARGYDILRTLIDTSTGESFSGELR